MVQQVMNEKTGKLENKVVKERCVCCLRPISAMFPPSEEDPRVCRICASQGLKAPKDAPKASKKLRAVVAKTATPGKKKVLKKKVAPKKS